MATRGRKRATTRRLEPGEHSIAEAKPRPQADGSIWLDFSYRPLDGSKTKQRRAKGRTAGEARLRAHAMFDRILADEQVTTWKGTSSITDYMATVSREAIAKTRLTDSSRQRYLGVLPYLEGECSEPHQHAASLKGHSIISAVKFRVLERCLQEIAELHGIETAHQARSVLSKYVLDQLIRDDLITASPIAGQRIDLSGGKPRQQHRGGVAISLSSWSAVVTYLLALDPTEGIEKPKRGMYTLDDRIAKRRNVIELTLLQAMTGLRLSEARQVTWSMVRFTDENMVLSLPTEVVKGDKGRTVHVTHPGAVARFRARRERAVGPDAPIIGSPAKPAVPWDRRQATAEVATLYLEMARELQIDELLVQRSHVWRATLSTRTMEAGVPEATRLAHLGHSPEVARSHYTDASDGQALADKVTEMLDL